MKRFLIYLLLGLFLSSCERYPKRAFQFDKRFHEYIDFFRKNDTIYFQNTELKVDSFVITGIDSVIRSGVGMIAARASKEIDIRYRQLPFPDDWHTEVHYGKDSTKTEDGIFLTMEKHPDDSSQSICLNFENFLPCYKDSMGIRRFDTLIIDGHVFTQYLELNSPPYRDEPASITKIYWTNKYGILSYQYKNGDIWKRIKFKM